MILRHLPFNLMWESHFATQNYRLRWEAFCLCLGHVTFFKLGITKQIYIINITASATIPLDDDVIYMNIVYLCLDHKYATSLELKCDIRPILGGISSQVICGKEYNIIESISMTKYNYTRIYIHSSGTFTKGSPSQAALALTETFIQRWYNIYI